MQKWDYSYYSRRHTDPAKPFIEFDNDTGIECPEEGSGNKKKVKWF